MKTHKKDYFKKAGASNLSQFSAMVGRLAPGGWWSVASKWEWGGIRAMPFICLAGVALVVITGQALILDWPRTNLTEPDWQKGNVYELHWAAGQTIWVMIGVVQTICIICALALFGDTIIHPPVDCGDPRSAGAARRLCFAAIVLIGFLLVVQLLDRISNSRLPLHFDASEQLAHRALYDHRRVPAWLDTFMQISNGLAASVLVFGALATGAVIVDPGCPDPTSPEKTAKAMKGYAAQISRLRYLMTVSAATLIVGVIQILVQNRLPAAILTKEPREAANALASSVSAAAGAAFSLAMIAVYLPAVFVIKARIEPFVEKAYDPTVHGSDREKWQQSVGLAVPLTNLYDYAKILGPVIVGVGNFLKG